MEEEDEKFEEEGEEEFDEEEKVENEEKLEGVGEERKKHSEMDNSQRIKGKLIPSVRSFAHNLLLPFAASWELGMPLVRALESPPPGTEEPLLLLLLLLLLECLF